MTTLGLAGLPSGSSYGSLPGSDGNQLRITESQKSSIPRYSKFEAHIETNLQYTNPFDPREMDLQVHFLTPGGATHILPAFYDEEDGKPVWKVRYAPTSPGQHRYFASIGNQRTAEHNFECVSSDKDGFIRLSPSDHRYFQFDSGKPYFAVGHNVCWTDNYEHYFRRMAEHGENYTRIWMIHWNVALEWSGEDYPGLGRYYLGKARRIDHILDLAEQYGIYIMLCFESFNTLRIRQSYPAYSGNPYSRENGGMLETPEQFFTDPEAIRLFKQRLRYLVARYTYSTNILCWEFWNEVDIIEKYVQEDAVAWHQEMARYLRQIDPIEHPISTSFARTPADSAIWELPEMEITQNHQYGSKDIAESVRKWTQRNVSEFRKPHIFGEFGVDAGGPRREKDPDGIGLHNGIWAAALSGSAGTAMLWWWDNYIDPNNLYYHFQPLSQFVEDVDWPRANFRDIELGTIDFAEPIESDTEDSPSLRVFGLQNDTEALLWIQNTQHTWYRMFEKMPLKPVAPSCIEIKGLESGKYIVQWWDTYKTGAVENAHAVCADGILRLDVPEIERDIACKLRVI